MKLTKDGLTYYCTLASGALCTYLSTENFRSGYAYSSAKTPIKRSAGSKNPFRASVNYKKAVHLCPSSTRFCKILTALSMRSVSNNKGRNARLGKTYYRWSNPGSRPVMRSASGKCYRGPKLTNLIENRYPRFYASFMLSLHIR